MAARLGWGLRLVFHDRQQSPYQPSIAGDCAWSSMTDELRLIVMGDLNTMGQNAFGNMDEVSSGLEIARLNRDGSCCTFHQRGLPRNGIMDYWPTNTRRKIWLSMGNC